MAATRTIFVAGATGVLGRRVVPQLVAAGHRVTAVARTPEKRAALAAAGTTPVQIDLFDGQTLRATLSGHDVLINLATRIPPSSRAMLPWAWRENDRLRRIASRELVTAARAAGVGRFIQESIAMLYQGGGDAWLDEAAPVRSVRHTHSALAAEEAALTFGRMAEAGIVLRIANLYCGESSHTRDTIRHARGGWAATFGSAEDFIASVAADDAAAAVLAALEVPSGIYNVSDDAPQRRREYFDALSEALGVPRAKLPPAWLAHLAGSVGEMIARSQRVSNRKLREASGWAPRFPSVREGWRAVLAEMSGEAGAQPLVPSA